MTLTKPHSRRAAIEQQITAYRNKHLKAADEGDMDLARLEGKRVDMYLDRWATADNETP